MRFIESTQPVQSGFFPPNNNREPTVNQIHSIAQPIPPSMPGAMRATAAGQGLTPAGHFLNATAGHQPTRAEIVQVVATFKDQAKAATLCADADCCCFGKSRAGSCACSQDPEAEAASALLSASIYAERAHRAHERRALNLQMNDKSGFYG